MVGAKKKHCLNIDDAPGEQWFSRTEKKEWSREMVRWSADDIIYEDEQILVCRKHSGMAVQSARIGQMDLESELKNYRKGKYIGIVQRSISRWKGFWFSERRRRLRRLWINSIRMVRWKRISGCLYRDTGKRSAGDLGGLSCKRRQNEYLAGDRKAGQAGEKSGVVLWDPGLEERPGAGEDSAWNRATSSDPRADGASRYAAVGRRKV